ncbi:hypothetical protein FDI40_gp386 [Agrobacterium phage Atu_ph07]|uniref:Uncharacterized protein n=1 Tax=Agrobacterium phage Atu_ph07 TaxID=2024264 RepID=A0A2L0V044_9CAUD|nr:hypothetical protein FDI40_gp386 [Agrobacterium phage Atu_ph07]AUZ95145.1 hypothetical protein [Agrobacterium phage Atu_ph07]
MTTVQEMSGFIALIDEHPVDHAFGTYIIASSIGAMTVKAANYTKAGVKLPSNSKKPAFLLKENHSITKVRR